MKHATILTLLVMMLMASIGGLRGSAPDFFVDFLEWLGKGWSSEGSW